MRVVTIMCMSTSDEIILALALYLPAVFAFVLGAIIASFLCVVVERVPRKKSINGRSKCICGRQLSGWENIPIVSWSLLRGRSRCCGSKIPAFYVLAELGLGLAWGLSVLLLGAWPLLMVAGVVISTVVMVLVGLRRTRLELVQP